MIPLDQLVREPTDQAVAASFRRLNQAIQSGDQARIDLVLAEISGLAARTPARKEPPVGLFIWQDSPRVAQARCRG